MNKIEKLNRTMLRLEHLAALTEDEYTTYKQLLEAVELLKELRNSLSQYDDGEWYLHDGTEPRLDYIDEVLEELK